jgi:hypothetical protein
MSRVWITMCKHANVVELSFIYFWSLVSQSVMGSAPGKAEMQLQLSQEQPAGKLSTIEFLSEGISIQESQ